MISYNTQIDNTNKKYKIQFETDDYGALQNLLKCSEKYYLSADEGNKKEGNKKPISKLTRLKVYQKYKGHCAYCGCKLALKDMQVDYIPGIYFYNGANDIEKYNPVCRMCNLYKLPMPIEDFRGQLGKLTSRL